MPNKIANAELWSVSEIRKASDWTPWVKVNSTKDGFMEQRFKFVCKANVPDGRFLRVTGVKTDLRFCSENGDTCSDKGELDHGDVFAKRARRFCHGVLKSHRAYKRKQINRPKKDNSADRVMDASQPQSAPLVGREPVRDSVPPDNSTKTPKPTSAADAESSTKVGTETNSAEDTTDTQDGDKESPKKDKHGHKENTVIPDKRQMYLSDAQIKVNRQSRHAFSGYCWCRDLGLMRWCKKCSPQEYRDYIIYLRGR